MNIIIISYSRYQSRINGDEIAAGRAPVYQKSFRHRLRERCVILAAGCIAFYHPTERGGIGGGCGGSAVGAVRRRTRSPPPPLPPPSSSSSQSSLASSSAVAAIARRRNPFALRCSPSTTCYSLAPETPPLRIPYRFPRCRYTCTQNILLLFSATIYVLFSYLYMYIYLS